MNFPLSLSKTTRWLACLDATLYIRSDRQTDRQTDSLHLFLSLIEIQYLFFPQVKEGTPTERERERERNRSSYPTEYYTLFCVYKLYTTSAKKINVYLLKSAMVIS